MKNSPIGKKLLDFINNKDILNKVTKLLMPLFKILTPFLKVLMQVLKLIFNSLKKILFSLKSIFTKLNDENNSVNKNFEAICFFLLLGGAICFLIYSWNHAEKTCMKNLSSMNFLMNTKISRSEAKEFCSCVKYELTPTYFTALFSSEEIIRKKEIEAGMACTIELGFY